MLQKNMGPLGGEETPNIPVGPDAPDTGDVLQGLAADGLTSGASSASGCMKLSSFKPQWHAFFEERIPWFDTRDGLSEERIFAGHLGMD